MKKIFVIDDEADVLTTIKAWGEKHGYAVTTFQNEDGFLDSLIEKKPQAVLVDVNLKDDDGRFISEDLKNILPFHTKIILISADPAALSDYDKHAADDVLHKPFTLKQLDEKLKLHLTKK